MKTNRWIPLMVSLCFFFLTSNSPIGLASAAPTDMPVWELKYSHHNQPGSRNHKTFFLPMGKRIEAATKGRVKVIDYPAQTLNKSQEMLEAVESGLADMVHIVPMYYRGRFPLSEVANLPALCHNLAETNSRMAQELFETTPEIQKEWATVKVLFFHATRPYLLATTNKAVRRLEEMKGLKLACSGTIGVASVKRLGAVPMMIPLPDYYEAGQKGIIDGGMFLPSMYPTFRLYEVFHYWTEVPSWGGFTAEAMNLDRWNSFPPEIQQEIMSVCGMEGAVWGARAGWGPELKDMVHDLARKSDNKLEDVELETGEAEKFKAAVQPIWDEWKAEMANKGLPGEKIFNKYMQLYEKYKD